MNKCEEYIDFVTKTIQDEINHQYSIQGRNIDDITGVYAKVKIEALKELAERLGVDLNAQF